MEFGESLEDCAAREVKEETGVVVGNIRFHAVTNDVFPEDGIHSVTVWMAADYGEGEPIPSDESIEVAWFARDKLPEPLFLSFANLIKGQGLPRTAYLAVATDGSGLRSPSPPLNGQSVR